jgi:hypothetical protein
MGIRQSIYLKFDVTVFDTEEVEDARTSASESNGVLYCWKTSGISNWLEEGLSMSDVLAIVVLPRGLPQQIDMLDDRETDE